MKCFCKKTFSKWIENVELNLHTMHGHLQNFYLWKCCFCLTTWFNKKG